MNMRKLVLIVGPQAVGKMSVGQELEKRTGLKLFHNHMTIELLQPFFGFTPEMWRLANRFRLDIIEAMARSDQYGLIFTYVWAFDQQADWDFIGKVRHLFESNGGEMYLVELEAEIEERLIRNRTPNRLEHKPTKRNVELSEQELKRTMEKYRLNSLEGEITCPNYVRINNTALSPAVTAELIIDAFQLEGVDDGGGNCDGHGCGGQ